MKKRNKIAYGILLPVMAAAVLAGSVCLPESHARYVSVAGWNTQVYDPENTVTSSLLAQGGHTAVLGSISPEDSYQLPVWFLSEADNCTGTLVCETVENGEYITADFPQQLTLAMGVRQTFTLTLTPTQIAQSLTETVTVTLQMYWKENPDLKATLQLTLTPSQTQSPSQPSGTLQDLSGYVTVMEKYAPGGLLGMTCNIPEGCTAWRLGLLDENSLDVAFPAGTRYTLDGGQSYYMLPKDGWIDLPVTTGAPVSIWFDFSRVETAKIIHSGILSITVSGESAGQWYGKNVFSVNADLQLPANSENSATAVVTRNTPLQLSIPQNWENIRLEYTLTRHGTHSDAPMPAVTVKENKMIISAQDAQPKAGTYTLELVWMADQLQVASRRVVFFVNYTPYAEGANTLQTASILTEGEETV